MSGKAFSLLHRGVQNAIYKQGWTELHPIQAESINVLLQSRDHLLVCAQTAGGKTEAAFLPIISQLASKRSPSVQALYVGPLVALINDQFQRLEFLCQELKIPVHRWHGMASQSEKKRFRDSPSGILLITPESLESNFINYGPHLSRIYSGLEYVVIDEMHCFLSDVRGVHLQSLIHRLRPFTDKPPRMIGLSATLGDPVGARAFLAPGNPDSVSIVSSQRQRSAKFGISAILERQETRIHESTAKMNRSATEELVDGEILQHGDNENNCGLDKISNEILVEDGIEDIAEQILWSCRNGTNLVFANSKQKLELLADRLHHKVKEKRWPRDPFHVHHGSLSKDARESAELELKSGKPTTVLCSSTLELGIDIGSVKRVIQLDPPWSVASMRQRLGRSGRRDGEASIMRLFTCDSYRDTQDSISELLFPNLVRSLAMTRLMLAKWLEPHDCPRLHLSTLIHQIISCLKQTGGLRADELFDILITQGAFPNISTDIYCRVLKSLGNSGIIEQMPQGELILAPEGESIVNNWQFYAAFQSSEEFTVRHQEKAIGKLQSELVPPVGDCLLLGGRRWCVIHIDTNSKTVAVVPAKNRQVPAFLGSAGELHNRVVEEMRQVLLAENNPVYLNSKGKQLLDFARHTAKKTDILGSGLINDGKKIQWFPWVGTRAFTTLLLHAKIDGIQCSNDVLSITYHKLTIEQFRTHLQAIVTNQRTPLQLAEVMDVKTFEKYDEFLDERLLDEANANDRVDQDNAMKTSQKTLVRI